MPVTVSWSATDPDGIQRNELYASTNGGAYAFISLPSPAATSIVRDIAPGTQTQYRARAFDTNNVRSGYATGPPW